MVIWENSYKEKLQKASVRLQREAGARSVWITPHTQKAKTESPPQAYDANPKHFWVWQQIHKLQIPQCLSIIPAIDSSH